MQHFLNYRLSPYIGLVFNENGIVAECDKLGLYTAESCQPISSVLAQDQDSSPAACWAR